MADTRLTSLSELAATPADNDMLYIVDVSDTTDDAAGSGRKIQAKRWVKTDGTPAQVNGGGVIALGGYTLTVPATGTVQLNGALLASMLAVDGAGSGLDADLLDGVQLATILNYYHPQTIPILAIANYADFSVVGTIYAAAPFAGVYLNASYIPSHLKVYLYLLFGVDGASTAYGRLYNRTTGAAVAGGEVSHVFSGSDFGWYATGDLRAGLAAGLNRYDVELKNSSGSRYTYCQNAQLVIVP